MGTGLKKFITAALVMTLIVPVAFLSQPKPAEAVGGGAFGCIFNALGLLGPLNGLFGKVFGGGGGGGFGGQSVPVNVVNLSTVEKNTGKAASEAEKSNVVTCILNAVVWDLANTMIKNFTASVVDWINRGFDGSPSFVTDPEGFFTDIGDQVAGQWIEGLGPMGRVLCSPFDLRIRLALGLGFQTRKRYDVIRCRLSDVQRNIYNAFLAGQWNANANSNGWSNWIAVSQPMNNPYGVYLYGQDAISQEILNKVGLKQQELQQGGGFLSWRPCLEYVQSDDEGSDRHCGKYGPVQTPGSVIQAQLNQVLPSSMRKLEVADSVNEIVNALADQAIGQIFKPGGGLLGMSKGSSYYGGKSYVSSLMTTYGDQLAAGEVLPPQGISCSKTYRTNVDASNNVVVEEMVPGRWQRNNGIMDGTRNCLAGVNTTLGETAECFVPTPTNPPLTLAPGQTPAQYEKQIEQGCTNLGLQYTSNDAVMKRLQEMGIAVTGSGGTAGGAGGAPVVLPDINLAAGKDTSMSSPTHTVDGFGFGYFTSDKAVDGQKLTCLRPGDNGGSGIFIGPASAAGKSAWWQVDLGSEKLIKKIKVYTGFEASGAYCVDNTQNFSVSLLSESGSLVKSLKPYSNSATIGNIVPPTEILLTGPVKARYVKIENEGSPNLILGEVEVWGTDVPPDQTTPTGAPQSVCYITTANVTNYSVPPATQSQPSQITTRYITISPLDQIPNITLQANISLVKIVGIATTSVPLNSIFSSITANMSLLPNQASTDSLNITPPFPQPTLSNNDWTTKPINNVVVALPQPASRPDAYNLQVTANLKQANSLLFSDIHDLSTPIAIQNQYETYRLEVEVTESSTIPPKYVGKYTHTFTLIPNWQTNAP